MLSSSHDDILLVQEKKENKSSCARDLLVQEGDVLLRKKNIARQISSHDDIMANDFLRNIGAPPDEKS